MTIHILTQTPDSALPLAALKAHLRLGTGFSENSVQDPVLVGFLRAAMSLIEARIGKVLLSQTVDWTQDSVGSKTPFPLAPVRALTHVLIQQDDGPDVDVSAQFAVLQDTHRPCLVLANTPVSPLSAGEKLVVRFDVGLATAWEDVPSDIAQAVLLLATHYYEHRDQTGLDQACMPFGVTALLQRYRNLRLSHGGAAQ